MSLKIKANEELFNKWGRACDILNTNKAIVQNDMDISKKNVNNWWKLVDENVKDLLTVRKEIIDYIKKINE